MRYFTLLLLLLCPCHIAGAAPSRVWWPAWTISSSEELSQGIKYSRNSWTPNYPLTRMFDDSPATAWVFSSTSNEWDKSSFASRYGVELKPHRPMMIDGLRLMNGHNQSRARFLRNDRVTQIRVTMSSGRAQVARMFDLSDQMGWHKISWPPQMVKNLKIEFTRIRRGTGPKNDLCISELALLNGGRKVDLKVPRAVMFYDGLEGCGASALILKTGEVLDGIATDVGYEDEWSANGRYVCGLSGAGGDDDKAHLWIADANRGKVIRRIFHPGLEYKWISSDKLRIKSQVKNKPLSRIIQVP